MNAIQRSKQAGVTLVEVMVTGAVAAILATAGMPAISGLVSQAGIRTQTDALRSALRLARHEAMKRGEIVSVCARDAAAPQSDPARCSPNGKNWSAGWVVFVDRGVHGTLESADTVVQVQQSSQATGPVVATLRYLSFQPSGLLYSGMSHFRFQPNGAAAADTATPGSQLLCINKPGRMRVSKDAEC